MPERGQLPAGPADMPAIKSDSAALAALRGRTIVDVKVRRFPKSYREGRTFATDPILQLDNGTVLTFTVEETESDYGITLHVAKGSV